MFLRVLRKIVWLCTPFICCTANAQINQSQLTELQKTLNQWRESNQLTGASPRRKMNEKRWGSWSGYDPAAADESTPPGIEMAQENSHVKN